MSTLTVFLSALFFTLLGMAWIVGYDFVKKHSPQHLVRFYMLMATIRFVFVCTIVLAYAMFSAQREDAKEFAIMFIGMYVVMMVVTLIIKH